MTSGHPEYFCRGHLVECDNACCLVSAIPMWGQYPELGVSGMSLPGRRAGWLCSSSRAGPVCQVGACSMSCFRRLSSSANPLLSFLCGDAALKPVSKSEWPTGRKPSGSSTPRLLGSRGFRVSSLQGLQQSVPQSMAPRAWQSRNGIACGRGLARLGPCFSCEPRRRSSAPGCAPQNRWPLAGLPHDPSRSKRCQRCRDEPRGVGP